MTKPDRAAAGKLTSHWNYCPSVQFKTEQSGYFARGHGSRVLPITETVPALYNCFKDANVTLNNMVSHVWYWDFTVN